MSQVSHSHLVFVHGVSVKGSESKRHNTLANSLLLLDVCSHICNSRAKWAMNQMQTHIQPVGL